MTRSPSALVWLVASWVVLTTPVAAQRVQFPTTVPSPDVTPPGYTVPGLAPVTQPSIVPSFDPYANPSLGIPPGNVPYNVAPQLGQPQYSAPVLPQAAPPVTPGVPQQGGSLFPNGLPYQWESGSYYQVNSDGTVARLQRLLQQISVEQTWLYAGEDVDELGINRTELAATFGMPIFYNPDTPLLITPGFAFNWLEGPRSQTQDLPPQVYDAYLDAAWHPKLSQMLSADLGLRTGVWSDFKEVNGESVRLLGRGLGVLALSPNMDVLAGVWYLDRNDIRLLPAGGIHWRPSDLWDMYLVFPNPKIRRRSINVGASQWWVYFAGEYGGGRWTVERLGGGDDIDINDIRAIFGIEWETQTQARGHIEVGYVFKREIIFDETNDPTMGLDDTMMIRGGFDF